MQFSCLSVNMLGNLCECLWHPSACICICDSVAFVIWQTNWQQDAGYGQTDRQTDMETDWDRDGDSNGDGDGDRETTCDCLSAFMYARNLVLPSAHAKHIYKYIYIYIFGLSLSFFLCGMCLWGTVFVCATRSTFYFPSNKSIFRTTKNENEKRIEAEAEAEADASYRLKCVRLLEEGGAENWQVAKQEKEQQQKQKQE